MFRSYFTIALRSLMRHKGYSLIKIAGLSFGLAASMIIYLYIREDLSYDKFHSKYERIVRLLTIDNAEGVSSKQVGVTQPRLGPAAEEELPEVVKSVRFAGGGRYDLAYGDKTIKCEQAYRVDPSFFEVFDFEIISGEKKGALDKPGSIVITQSLARKIFGDENPIGKTLKLNLETDLNITAVLADPPKNSHIQFDLLRTLVPGQNEDGFRQALDSWQSIFVNTYLLLDKPMDVNELATRLQAISKKNNAFEFFTPTAQKLEAVHLKSKGILFENNANKADELNVIVLSIVSLLILVLAAVNFMNLVTAKSTGRAKEVGMRKVIGAVKTQLIGQHLVESVIITMVAGMIAFGIVFFATPFLNSTYQRFADPMMLLDTSSLLIFAGLIIVVGIFSGLYPAFILSAYKPAVVLKGSFKNSASGIRLRKALVVVQFTISIALMVGTGIVYEQMQYIYHADLGYNREQVVTIQQNGNAIERTASLRNELLRDEHIVSVGSSSTRIGQQLGRTNIIPEGATAETNIITSIMVADEHFVPAMNMSMKAGRNFSPNYDDSLSMIVNEEMLRLLKWDDAVGKKISLQSGPNPTDLTAYTVVGVIKDFHFATIRHKLEPMFMLYGEQNPALSIKVKAENMNATLAFIEETWKKVNPGTTFEYNFLDEQFANLYRNEQAFATMFTHFTVLAILIAALGLFALSAFTAEQRRKEIGIRKVLGASNQTILFNLSGEFIKLIAVAFVAASAIGYYVMGQWLKDFQYSIKIGFEIFLIAGLSSLAIAMLTVSYQALRASFSNPVDSLRSE